MTQPKTASAEIDPHDGLPILVYLGDAEGNPHIIGVPARDLHGGDLHRLARIDRRTRQHQAYVDADLEPPADLEPMTPESLAAELVDRELYRYATEADRKAAADEDEEPEAEKPAPQGPPPVMPPTTAPPTDSSDQKTTGKSGGKE